MLIILASVPAAHPYVDAVVDPEAVALLPDPVPPEATLPGQWWPPQWLEHSYLRGNLHRADLLHVHFGFDTADPVDLHALVDTLAERNVPLIVTVHDLHNPHFRDVTAHAARLDVLIPAASAVVTLTDGAAAEIHRRWDRDAIVLAHPHVLPIGDVGAQRPARATPVVAVHAKALRANVDPWPVLDALVRADRTGWRLRLDVDADAMASPRSDEVAVPRLDAYRAAGVDVRIHPRFDDAELVNYLKEVDVMVLPYRFGSHSGWVEACFDAGVHTVVPDCGYFHLQQRGSVFGFDDSGCDDDALVRGVGQALRRAAETPSGMDLPRRRSRAAQRLAVRRETVSLYRRVLAERAAA